MITSATDLPEENLTGDCDLAFERMRGGTKAVMPTRAGSRVQRQQQRQRKRRGRTRSSHNGAHRRRRKTVK